MGLESFYLSGAVMTMPDGHTYFGFDLKVVKASEQLGPAGHFNNSFYLNPNYNLTSLNVMYVPNKVTHDKTLIISAQDSVSLKPLEWSTDWSLYKKTYIEFQNHIRQGHLKKAVPFTSFKTPKPVDFNKLYLPMILNKLLQSKIEDQFIYGLWNSTSGFVGLTPEVLIEKKKTDANFGTMALAGTLAADNNLDMLSDPKLVEEHQLVIQDIANKLHDHELNWTKTCEKNYGPIKHLLSQADFKSNLDLNSLIARLAPTSAVGTYPSELWVEHKDLLQIDSRGAYGAPFGLAIENQIRVVVCLRGLFWDENFLYINVGGGITLQSDYIAEVNELKLKFESTRTKLGL